MAGQFPGKLVSIAFLVVMIIWVVDHLIVVLAEFFMVVNDRLADCRKCSDAGAKRCYLSVRRSLNHPGSKRSASDRSDKVAGREHHEEISRTRIQLARETKLVGSFDISLESICTIALFLTVTGAQMLRNSAQTMHLG